MAATRPKVTASRGPSPRLVQFPSGDAILRGLLYEQGGSKRRPTVIMAHGFSATVRGMVADRYAEVIHGAGANVLLFDHRGLGMSGGEPRLVLNRWTELRGYRDAIDFVCTLPTLDRDRVGVWGDSTSGATALAVAAFDERVSAVVAQVPACGSAPAGEAPGAYETLRALYRAGGPEGVRTETIGPRPVVSPDQVTSPSHLTPITAFRWFIDYGGRPGTGWQNVATVETAQTAVQFHVGYCAPHLQAASFWLIAPDDEMPGAEPDIAEATYRSVAGQKSLLSIEGGHFGLLYHSSETFAKASRAQAAFFAGCL